MASTPKTFDLVVHGATGFTGRLVVEYLLAKVPAGSGVRWAMGGRSRAKLEAVRDELGAPAGTPLVVTDLADPASLAALMAATRLVLTTVGPYQLYGNELVAACAAQGVDYVDLCGEPAWMRQMIDAHEARHGPAARASCSPADSTRSPSTSACGCCRTTCAASPAHRRSACAGACAR